MKQAKRPSIPCHHCNGCGQLELSDDMWRTLQWVRAMRHSHAAEVAEGLGWSGHITAINNRLEFLRKQGLLKRERAGKIWIYSPV